MLELIIWAIIIFAIYAANKKKAEKNRQNQQSPVQQNYRQQPQVDMAAKQRELKQRLQQKYAGQNVQYRAPQPQQRPVQQNPQYRATQPQQRPVQQNPQYRAPQPQQRPVQQNPRQEDIFSRAVASVEEYEKDVPEKSALMDELDDLMLMGYQAEISFERDFLAEGIEMLNSYEVPGI